MPTPLRAAPPSVPSVARLTRSRAPWLCVPASRRVCLCREALSVFGCVAHIGADPWTGDVTGKLARQPNPYPFRGFKEVAHTTTDSKGAYRFTVKPIRHTRYRTVSPSPAAIYDTVIQSPQVLVHVRLRVGIGSSTSTPRRGERVRF